MAGERWKWVPNALTVGRIALASLVFFILAGAAGALPGQDGPPSARVRTACSSWPRLQTSSTVIWRGGWTPPRLGA
jgi:hypothetical protein